MTMVVAPLEEEVVAVGQNRWQVTIGMMMTKTKEPYGMKPMNTDKLF